ncbi:MAG: outer membrane beta-barrel protein [Bacteroidota bacterium]|nr:outer membrane beta-barrel protein [Bacteroidota bacterium]
MRRYFYSFFVLLFLSMNVYAQALNSNQQISGKGTISGNVLEDVSGKPIVGATVIISSIIDSVFKFTNVSDKNGFFGFDKLPNNVYRLVISVTGYSNYVLDSIVVRDEKNEFNVGELRLKSATNNLNEVVVYAEKPLIENKDGKIVYNVSESPLSNGSSTAEMLKNVPMVNTNPDGKVLLRGKEPLILLDDKPTNLNGQQLTDLLESLPANVVEKIEVMLNPPPEYATYDGGVINIITRKGRIGVYERFSVSAGTKGEESATGSFSYRTAKLNVNANAGYGISKTIGNSFSRRENFYTDSVNYFYTDASYKSHYQRPNFRLQTDYDFSKRSTLSFVYQGNLSYFDNNSHTLYTNLDSTKTMYKASTRSNATNGNGYSHGINASWQWKGVNPIEKLQVMSGFNAGKNDNLRDFYQQFLQYNFLPTGIDSTQNQFTDGYTNSFYTRVNYNKPLNDTGTIILTTGASYSTNGYHNILNTSYLRHSDSSFVLNDLLSNDFYFHQHIFTVRGGFIFTLPYRLKLITSAQAEYTGTDFQFIKGNANDVNNGYWRLLPSVTLRKEFTRELNGSFTFRETIRRPGITQLNPSIDYSDPYNVRFGNPFIVPSLTDNYDVNISYNTLKLNINSAFGYNKVKDVFNSIRTLISTGKTQTTWQNISDQNEYHFSFWSGYTVSSKLRINLSSGYNYNQYSDIEKQLYRYTDGGSFYTGLNCSFMPDKLTNIELANRYSSFANPQGRSHSNVNMTLGLQRKFMKKQLIVGITAIDPFGLLRYNGYTQSTNFIIESYSSSNTQNFRLTISYQFNKTRYKASLDEKQKQDALNKVNSKNS